MKYFRWEFIKRHVNITHLIAFSLGVIVICFLDALIFEKSIADWVSSTANIIMSLIAFYAILAWHKNKVKETAFNYLNVTIQQTIKIHEDVSIFQMHVTNYTNSPEGYAEYSKKRNREHAETKVILEKINELYCSLIKLRSSIYMYTDIGSKNEEEFTTIYLAFREYVNTVEGMFKEENLNNAFIYSSDIDSRRDFGYKLLDGKFQKFRHEIKKLYY